MSVPQPGSLATYNSLTDKHLAGYFSNTRIRRHLQRSGLISKSGRIIPEKEYRLNAMKRDHQRYVQECLARAIFHKVLDMERHHQLEIKRKLENSVKKERVQKIKVDQSRRSVEGVSYMRPPHPPLGPRHRYGLHPSAAGEPAGHSQLRAPGPVAGCPGGHPSQQHRAKEPAFSKMTSWRPNTAPGNMQRPLRLQPLRSCAVVGSVPKAASSKQKCHALENSQQFASEEERSGLRLMNSVECVTGVSPYRLPVISNPVIPVPPAPPQRAVRNGAPRGRRFRPTTAPNGLEQLLAKNSGGFPKPSLRSNVLVTMVFLGKSVHLSHDDADYRDEIKVYQQHCGGENLCVYKGKLLEGETFQFVSKRHHGFPFSLTFFLNGMQVDRLSCCCEYKHQKRSRLGGRHGYFGFLNVEGASPCYRCIIAMGLDKKPSPPKRKMEHHEEKHVGSWRDGVHSEPSKSSVEQKSSKDSVLVIIPGHEVSAETIEDKMEPEQECRKEEREKLPDRESEDSQEDTAKNEYDEDFEADEEINEEGQTGDQMNGMSKSSPDDKEHNLDSEKESKSASQKALQASDSEKDESDGYSDSDCEDDKQGGRPARSLSSVSTQCSSEDDSRGEMVEDDVQGKEECNIKRASGNAAHAQYGKENGETKLLRMEENQETFTPEKEGIDEAEKAKPEHLTAREDTGIFNENIVAIQHQIPEVNGELKQAGSVESNEGEDGEKAASTRRDDGEEGVPVPLESSVTGVEDSSEESPQSDEGDDCKLVQEEIATATGNNHHVNLEPEPSDSRADEEEENVTNTECDAEEAPDGAVLAEGTGALDVQKAAEEVAREGQMAGERRALGEGDGGAEGAGEVPRAGELWAQGLLAPEPSAPEESAVAGEDPEGKAPGKGREPVAEVAPGEQAGVMEGTGSEAALGEQVPGAEEPAAAPRGGEEDGAVSEGQEVAGEVSEVEGSVGGSEEEEADGAAGPAVPEAMPEVEAATEATEEGGFAGKGVVAGAVSEGEEAVEDASVAEEGIAGVVGPEGEEPVEEAVSEGEEAVEKPGALLETLGDTSVCAGEALLGREGFVKPNEFSQLKASGEERMEMGRAAMGAAASESGQAAEVEGSSLLGAGEPEEPGEGPVLPVAPGLEALVDAGGDATSEGSPQLEETTAVEEEEGSAEALLSGNPSLVSKAETGSAAEGKPDGGVMGAAAERAGAQSGGGEEVARGAAGPRELVAGMEGSQACAEETGEERAPGEAAWPAAALGVRRAQEAGLVAIAVVGGQAGQLARLAEAGDGGVSPRHGDPRGATSLGEQPVAAPPASSPVHGDAGPRGRGSAGGQGLCPGSRPQLAAPGTGTAGDKDGLREGTGQVGVEAQGEQPGLCGSTGERGMAGVTEGALGAREQREDSPAGGSPDAPGAAAAGERSRSPRGDVVNPDAVVVPSVPPQDGEETLL